MQKVKIMNDSKNMTKNEELIDSILRDEELSHEEKVTKLSKLKGQAYHQGRADGAHASKGDIKRMLEHYDVPAPNNERSGDSQSRRERE